jgi:hypothetical protein
MNLFTLDYALIRGQLGRLGPADTGAVRTALRQLLDL